MDVVSLVVSIISLGISIANLVMYIILTHKYNSMVKTQTLTAQGAFETQIRSFISDATKNLNYYAVKLSRDPSNEILQTAYFNAEEQYRNAYEDACAKYIDGKIDKKRFEKMYKQEINQLVNDPKQKEYYATNQTTFSSTISVWKEWFGQP